MLDVVTEALGRALPVAAFLLAISAVAELSDRAGVFDVAGHAMARLGRHRMWLLWLGFSALAVACTVFLSLDTTAVLLTSVGLTIARQVGAAPRAFALTTLWVANTGSLLLPVSNLTNLLALPRLEQMGVDHGGYVRLAAAPALVAVVLTLALVALLHRRELSARYVVDPPAATHDRVLLRVAATTCLVIGPAFALGAAPWLVAGLAALVLAGVTAVRAPGTVRTLRLPWAMTVGFSLLMVAVTGAHRAGLLDPLVDLAGRGTGAGDLLQVAGVSALTANAVNNLPGYLALEPAAQGEPARLLAVLVGANAGPLVTPWASLATLLWLDRCRAAGVTWRPWRLAAGGLLCVVVVVPATTLALALTT
ncbi:SLC13 family permease [Janibacter sp. UYMM211]|uniref:SLC13 family permease n=1 Tax=Janibacter sp. UYMM211 TaxID=3156342 RepID=UPI00339965D1